MNKETKETQELVGELAEMYRFLNWIRKGGENNDI
jgi:hypothetical protein